MKKKLLFLMALLAVSLLALAEMAVYVYKKDGTKVPYVASTVDSIGFVNVHTITFNANGGTGSMNIVGVKEGESITLPTNEFTNAKAEFVSWNTAADGLGIAYTDQSTITPTTNMTLYAQWKSTTSGFANGHEWVDLGLPSETKWATMNVGADSPEKYGSYFAWGERTPKSSYSSANYNPTWYIGSHPTTLPLKDDAAYTNWGNSWCMPTDAEFKELIDKCTWTWTTQNGVKGYKVTSKTNGNSIFLPAAGRRYDSDPGNQGSNGDYWSSSLNTGDTRNAYYLSFHSRDVYCSSYYRGYGRSVRPVLYGRYILGFDANGGSGSMSAVELDRNKSKNIPANTFTRHGYRFIGWNTAADGTGTAYADEASVTLVANQTLYAQWEARKYADGHEWVDLGLPSGTKWATCNVGADSPEDYGDYFAWGETTTKSDYSWSAYKWCKGSHDNMTKYCTSSSYGTVDNKTILDLSDDAAYVNWGTSWRMPTLAEIDELCNTSYTTWTWTTQNGVSGRKVTSKVNGNSIFLPAAGRHYDSDLFNAGSQGNYWSSSLRRSQSSDVSGLIFSSDGVDDYNSVYFNRNCGLPVRPVLRE